MKTLFRFLILILISLPLNAQTGKILTFYIKSKAPTNPYHRIDVDVISGNGAFVEGESLDSLHPNPNAKVYTLPTDKPDEFFICFQETYDGKEYITKIRINRLTGLLVSNDVDVNGTLQKDMLTQLFPEGTPNPANSQYNKTKFDELMKERPEWLKTAHDEAKNFYEALARIIADPRCQPISRIDTVQTHLERSMVVQKIYVDPKMSGVGAGTLKVYMVNDTVHELNWDAGHLRNLTVDEFFVKIFDQLITKGACQRNQLKQPLSTGGSSSGASTL